MKIVKNNEIEYLHIYIGGAGILELSKLPNWQTERITGFHLGVEWGKHGFAGGVLSQEDAIKLAEHIFMGTGHVKDLRRLKLERINELFEKEKASN